MICLSKNVPSLFLRFLLVSRPYLKPVALDGFLFVDIQPVDVYKETNIRKLQRTQTLLTWYNI